MRTSFLLSNNNDTYNDVVYEIMCLENGYAYTFLIKDAFSDGICCVEGEGSYTISIIDKIIKEGGNFGKSEELSFKFKSCSAKEDCDNEDASTTDICQPKAETCLYTPKSCDEYGFIAFVNDTTDYAPEETSWTISDKDGKIQMEGGPYQQSCNTYYHNLCLSYGQYD